MSRKIGNGLTLAAVLAILAAWAIFLRPPSLGGPTTYVVVRGSSMLPTYHAGDLVLVHRQGAYQVGQIVAYRIPAGEVGAGHILIHRIVGGDASHGFVLRGDNNTFSDPWLPRQSDMVGAAWMHFAGLGRTVVFIHQPVIMAGLAAALTVALILGSPPRRRLLADGC
jgi:signal peptidase